MGFNCCLLWIDKARATADCGIRVVFGDLLLHLLRNYCSVFVPGRSRAVQKLKKWGCTARGSSWYKNWTTILTVNVKVNPRRWGTRNISFVSCVYSFPQHCMPYRLSVAAGLFTNLFWLVIKTHERHMRETTRLQKSAVKRRLIDEGRCDGRLTAKSPEKKTFTPEKKRGKKK